MTAIPDDVKRDMERIAPMLRRLGYDPNAYPPNYGNPDTFVSDNTEKIRNNEDYWRKKLQEVVTKTKPAKELQHQLQREQQQEADLAYHHRLDDDEHRRAYDEDFRRRRDKLNDHHGPERLDDDFVHQGGPKHEDEVVHQSQNKNELPNNRWPTENVVEMN